jgi:hypothetical protein
VQHPRRPGLASRPYRLSSRRNWLRALLSCRIPRHVSLLTSFLCCRSLIRCKGRASERNRNSKGNDRSKNLHGGVLPKVTAMTAARVRYLETRCAKLRRSGAEAKKRCDKGPNSQKITLVHVRPRPNDCACCQLPISLSFHATANPAAAKQRALVLAACQAEAISS